jgi:tight adherence protein C
MSELTSIPEARLALAAAIGLMALAMLVIGGSLALRLRRQGRSKQVFEQALAGRDARRAQMTEQIPTAEGRMEAAKRLAQDVGERLGEGRFGDSLMAMEDRRLIDICGYNDVLRARAIFMFARALLALVLPLLGLAALDSHVIFGGRLLSQLIVGFCGIAVGWMAPKWFLARRAAARRRSVAEELPLFIDLLRLLQGVGLSIDQSLHVIVHEFQDVMPVLALELRVASDLYARGRTREQSLTRLMSGFANDDVNSICRLIIQVDKHGGAVQEPLTRFSERVRERRKLEMREKVARLTVKMTGVMVVTLLPALLIVTGGAGLLAVIRSLTQATGHS